MAQVHAYIRASTALQEQSPGVQQEIIRRYCEAHQLGDPLIYIDIATSGSTFLRERECGSKLCRNLKRGDHIVVATWDRAFRRLSDCVNMMDECERRQVHLHVCNIPGFGAIDLTIPAMSAMFKMMAVFAEFERKMIRERVRNAIHSMMRQKLCVSSKAPYGFKFQTTKETTKRGKPKKIVVPDPAERAVMALIVKLREVDALSFHEIRKKLAYELGIKNRLGKEWGFQEIWKAHKAELLLQAQEKVIDELAESDG